MKTHVLPAALLSFSLLFAGCSAPADTSDGQADGAVEYLATIASLEAELEEEKQKSYESAVQHKAELLALKQQLDALNGKISAEEETPEELVFRYRLENGKAVITGFEGGSALLNIPATLDGHPVVAIGERAFEGSSIVGVVLPEGISSVGWFAFYGCKGLTHVTLPTSVSSIGYAVFDGCDALTLFCPAGSYAEAYAKSYGLRVFGT